MKYVYPVVFEKEENKILVRIPDIKGFTVGNDIADAFLMAKNALGMVLAHYEDNDLNRTKRYKGDKNDR